MNDRQGRNIGEAAPNKGNQRPREHDADAVSKLKNKTKDNVNRV